MVECLICCALKLGQVGLGLCDQQSCLIVVDRRGNAGVETQLSDLKPVAPILERLLNERDPFLAGPDRQVSGRDIADQRQLGWHPNHTVRYRTDAVTSCTNGILPRHNEGKHAPRASARKAEHLCILWARSEHL